MNDAGRRTSTIQGEEHWTKKGDVQPVPVGEAARSVAAERGTILFVHGSSMASQPTFDLQVPGRADSSAMDYFAARGFDTWCVDMEGYGRSTKTRDINATISNGADDLLRRRDYIEKLRGKRAAAGLRHLVGRAARGAVRAAPSRAGRSGSRSTPSSGPAKAPRRWPSAASGCRNSAPRTARPIDRDFVRSIFERDHPGTADDNVIEAFADAILELDDSMPTGTYVDMCIEPAGGRSGRRSRCRPSSCAANTTASPAFDDLMKFFEKLPNPDKQFAVMPGIAHASFQQKNYVICLPHPAELLHAAGAGLHERALTSMPPVPVSA